MRTTTTPSPCHRGAPACRRLLASPAPARAADRRPAGRRRRRRRSTRACRCSPGRPVHRQLRLHRPRRPGLRRVRRALRRQGRGHRHRRLPHPLAPARHPGQVRRRASRSPPPAPPSAAARWPTAPGSRCASAAPSPRRPATPTTSRWCGSTPATAARSTPRSRSGAARPASPSPGRRPAAASTPTASPACAPTTRALAQDRRLARSTNGGWGWDVYTATPGIPGDSGSGFLDARGRAVGTLSTVASPRSPASNGLGDLERELRYAQRHSGIGGLRLVRGTKKFSPVL